MVIEEEDSGMAKGRGASKTLSSDITDRKRVEHNLKERIKELDCLYGIARIAERPDFTLDELYQEVVNLLPSSWQYPEITCARITINGKKFKTENCRETEWKQSSDIKVHGAKAGILEVGYLEERPELDEGPFLKEERLLIDAAAKQLGRITDRKQMEQALQQSEEKLQTYLESAPDGVYINDLKGTFLYGNKKAEELTGYNREEILGKSFLKLNLLPAKYLAKAGRLLALNAMGKPTGPDELELIKRDGSRIWVEITTTPIKQGEGKTEVIGFVRDITEHKQAEEEIRMSEERYRHLFENLNDAAFLADAETGHILETNRQGEVLLGMSRNEIVGIHQSALHPPGKAEEYKQRFATHIARGHAADHEGEVIRKDGTIIPVSIGASPLTIQGRRLILGLFRDTTERKQAEEALADEATRRRILVDQSRDGIVILDQNGKVYEANQQFAEMLGYSPEEVAQLHVWDWDTQWTREQLLEMIQSIDAAGDHFETYHRRKDGTVYDVEISTNGAVYAGQKLVFCVCRDITERKQAEEALRKSEEKYRTLFESKLDGMVVIDETMEPLLANKTTAEMFGFDSVEELLEVNIFDYIPPEERERALKIITKDMFEKDMRQVNEFRLRTKSGKEIWVSAIGALTEYEGKVAGLISLRDITERKRMEEQLVRSEKLAAIGQLASGVAHELRGPLGAIKTAAFYVQRKLAKSDLPATEPKVLEFLDIIDGEVNIASNVISDLIDFSRVAKPTISPVNIGGIIEDALKHVPIPENVNLARDIDKSLPMVVVDAGQIQQVFVNVIFNAVEAMPQGGRLGIRAGSKGEFVEVEFTDTGYGIPRSAIDNIFDPLFTTKARGIGLGLAVCKNILERHGGDIGVKSKVGKGSTFTVSLPAQVV